MLLPATFCDYATTHRLFTQQNLPLLLAFSSGSDSVALFHLLRMAGVPFAVAHCNFGLRADESDGDEVFARQLCAQHNVTFYGKRFDTLPHAEHHKISIQMAARELRYAWFDNLCQTHGYGSLATAHHANDQLETVLLNLVRGTGIAGLRGMLPSSRPPHVACKYQLIRPLLFATKAQILAYLQHYQFTWREDSSNQKEDYARNFIRHQVVPLLHTLNPQLAAHFAPTTARLHLAELMLQSGLKKLYDDVRLHAPLHETRFSLRKIKEQPEPVAALFYLLEPVGLNYAQAEQILQAQHSGSLFMTATHALLVDRDVLVIRAQAEYDNQTYTLDDQEHVQIAIGHIQATVLPHIGQQPGHSPRQAWLDAALLEFPLKIRRWQQGDKFRPLGMRGLKKISDFLVDKKLNLFEKEAVWVVMSGNEIAWVIGHRIDDRFKWTPFTKEICLLDWAENH